MTFDDHGTGRALLLLGFAWALLGAGCRGQGGTVVPRADAGNDTRTCVQTVDCGGQGVCVAGLCQNVSSCTVDGDCASEGKICHQARFFCVECDGRPDQCGTGRTCQFDFTCVMIGTNSMDGGTGRACSGACTDRSMCGNDQVCDTARGECCEPKSRCTSPADCPASRPECNGATGQCFGGDGCFDDLECANAAGCTAGACFCDLANGTPGLCRVRDNECGSDMDCWENGAYAGKFCTLDATPRRCLPAPPCTSDRDCANDGLVCDQTAGSPSQGRCVNGAPCPMGNECGPTQACVGAVCVAQNCGNTPSLCSPTETCDPVTLTCVPMAGGACTMDTDCPAGRYCNTSVSPGRCDVGCRDNNDCPGGVCTPARMCEYPTGGLCGGCTSDADCPAGARCVNNPFTGMTCYEQCSMILNDPCTDPMDDCIFGNCSCL